MSPAAQKQTKTRLSVTAQEPTVLSEIYADHINLAVWQRALSQPLKQAVAQLLKQTPRLSLSLSPKNAPDALREFLCPDDYTPLIEDISELVDMFACLFELERVGLRLTALNRAMCPKFHVDRVACRLITTYQGIATQWVPHHLADRAYLGPVDSQVGLVKREQDIETLSAGDVALLKGENWLGNENAGLIHRSPAPPAGENRLLLTLDFLDT